MATPIVSKLYTVTVTFDSKAAKKFTFTGDIANDDITVDSYMGLIVLRLEIAAGSQDAEYLTNPIEWFQSEIPDSTMPTPFTVQRDSAKQVTLININTNGTQEGVRYGFRVLVQSGGQVYSSTDPTVINKEPPTGEVRLLSDPLAARLQRRVA